MVLVEASNSSQWEDRNLMLTTSPSTKYEWIVQNLHVVTSSEYMTVLKNYFMWTLDSQKEVSL